MGGHISPQKCGTSDVPPLAMGLLLPRILLLEDLWVTGARAQSMAHALKHAGAHTVITVASDPDG